MSLTEFALKRSRLTVVLLLVIMLGGISAYLSLPQSEDPEFTIRTALVVTYFPGASPARVEQLVTDKTRAEDPGDTGTRSYLIRVPDRCFSGLRGD